MLTVGSLSVAQGPAEEDQAEEEDAQDPRRAHQHRIGREVWGGQGRGREEGKESGPTPPPVSKEGGG